MRTLELLPGNILVCSILGDVLWVNRSFSSATGYSINPGSSIALRDMALEGDSKLVDSFLEQLALKSSASAQLTIRLNDGGTSSVLLEGALANSEGESLVIIHLVNLSGIVSEHWEQKRFLNSIIGNIPGLIYRCKNDKDWTMEYLSPYCIELTGYPVDEIIGNRVRSFNEIIHPNHRERLWNRWQNVLLNHTTFVDEYPIITSTGKQKWVWEQGAGVYGPNGTLLAIEGIIVDISERKRAIDTQRFQASLLDQIGDMITATDLEGGIVYVNKAETDTWGIPSDELIGKKAKIFGRDPLGGTTPEDIIQVTIKNGEWRGEVVNSDSHGRDIHLECRTWVVNDESGNPIALCNVSTDITKRKQAEEALRKSELLFRSLIENAFDAIFVVRNGVYEYVNNMFTTITGYTHEDISQPGFDLNQLLTNVGHRVMDFRKMNGMGEARLPKQFDLKLKSLSGATRDMEVSASYIILEGDVVLICIMHDVTNRKLVQEALMQSEQQLKEQNKNYHALNEELLNTNRRIQEINEDLMAAKSRADESERLKSAFLANMSHEIRTPMNGILGFSQLLLNPELSEAERGEFVSIVQNCGNQLLAIINDLIDISKIEADLITLIPSRVNLNELLNEQLLLCKSKMDNDDIRVSYSAGMSNAQSEILADGTRLRQILSNLLNNAFKFTRQGHITFGYTLKGDTLEFYVEDTGIGIPVDKHELIFNRFRQVETGLDRQAGGTGLGLTISKALIKKMGGSIWVQSEPYFGSTFFFTIPYVKPEPQHLEKEDDTPTIYIDPSSQIKILIAEDNEVNFLLIKELLTEMNPNIVWARNGMEAVEQVQSNPDIDLVLMDIKMPVMDGYQATQRIKGIRSDLPIIAQTAYSFATDRQYAVEAGCDDYISKPIDKDKFMEVLLRFIKVK